jgi:hypothetical protein
LVDWPCVGGGGDDAVLVAIVSCEEVGPPVTFYPGFIVFDNICNVWYTGEALYLLAFVFLYIFSLFFLKTCDEGSWRDLELTAYGYSNGLISAAVRRKAEQGQAMKSVQSETMKAFGIVIVVAGWMGQAKCDLSRHDSSRVVPSYT